ncbi:ABC transporter substrate-binding protein [Caldithrix abyssi]
MNKKLSFLLIVLLFFLAGCKRQPADFQRASFERIISLSPNLTETLYALGQGDKIVAVSDYCFYPPEVNHKERIGGLLNPNLEKILLLKPDLLIGTPAHAELARKLQAYQIPFVLLPNDGLNDVFFTIDSLGRLLNCPGRAKQLLKTIKDSLSYYQALSRQIVKRAPRAALIIGRDPGSVRHLTVVGPHTFLDSVWTFLGGKNIFSDLAVKYSQVGQESFLTRQPDLIIEFKFKEQWSARRDSLNKIEWQPLSKIPAVKHNQIYVLTGDYTLIPGPRVYELARDYYRILRQYAQKPF